MSCSQKEGASLTAQASDTIPLQKCDLGIRFRLKYSPEKDPTGTQLTFASSCNGIKTREYNASKSDLKTKE